MKVMKENVGEPEETDISSEKDPLNRASEEDTEVQDGWM